MLYVNDAHLDRTDPLSIVSVVGERVSVPELLFTAINGKLDAKPDVV